MSVNRSVQAAQRRRATPQPPPAPGMQNRGPQPSINSAQAFVNQSKTAPAPKLPLGKMSAQQLSQSSNDQSASSQGITSINKMTIAQAITLITLRLGKVETQLSQLALEGPLASGYQMTTDGQNAVLVDKSVIESINSRLESLEKRSSGSSGPEVALIKQQLEGLKPVVSQNKVAIGALIKDLKDVKTNVSSLVNELTESKELVSALQNLTMDNSQKIMDLTTLIELPHDEENQNNGELSEETHENEVENNDQMDENELLIDVVETQFKNIIEQELAEGS